MPHFLFALDVAGLKGGNSSKYAFYQSFGHPAKLSGASQGEPSQPTYIINSSFFAQTSNKA
jgi:hypothetical protein